MKTTEKNNFAHGYLEPGFIHPTKGNIDITEDNNNFYAKTSDGIEWVASKATQEDPYKNGAISVDWVRKTNDIFRQSI